MQKVYLALGSNIGDREKYLKDALHYLNKNESIRLIEVSKVYETEPVGYLEQDCFLNLVVSILTELEPYALLEYTRSVEQLLNRKRKIRWGPRTIDIDLLLYEHTVVDEEELHIPHISMWDRAFVLVPLNDIYRFDTIHNEMFSMSLDKVNGKETVRLYCEDLII